MAASKPVMLPRADIIKEIECRVCFEQKTLRILTCGHKCCQKCIGQIAAGRQALQCMVCRKRIYIPEGGFPKCFFSDYLRQQMSNQTPGDEGDNHPHPSLPTTSIPLALNFQSQHATNHQQCVTVHHHSVSGDILLGCADGMKIYSRRSGEVTHVVSYPNAKVSEYSGAVFFSSWNPSEETVNVYNYDMDSKQSETIFLFPQKSTHPSYLSMSAKYIAVIDKDYENIKMYNRGTGTVFTKQMPGLNVLLNLHLLPDDTLLITGWGDNMSYIINKYSVGEGEGEEPVLIWSCDQVPGAVGVAVDERGLNYVCRWIKKTIYILSAEGIKLAEMKHDQLPDYYTDMSVRDGEMAVSGWDDKNFKLFKLTN